MADVRKQTNIVIAVITLILILSGVYLIYSRSAIQVLPPVTVPPAGPITVVGTVQCLPHRDTSGPQTLECAFGLRDGEGRYYGLRDTDPEYRNVSSVPMNEPVRVIGVFVPRSDDKYQSIGVIEVEIITLIQTPQATTTPPMTSGGISGVVLLGPLCPVVREGEECPDRPFMTSLAITTPDGTRVIKTFNSAADGKFSVSVPAGEYLIRSAVIANVWPYCSSNGPVVVNGEAFTEITISCDTGIR